MYQELLQNLEFVRRRWSFQQSITQNAGSCSPERFQWHVHLLKFIGGTLEERGGPPRLKNHADHRRLRGRVDDRIFRLHADYHGCGKALKLMCFLAVIHAQGSLLETDQQLHRPIGKDALAPVRGMIAP